MKPVLKNTIASIYLTISLFVLFIPFNQTAFAAPGDTTYTPLAPLPGFTATFETKGSCPLGNYLNIVIKIIIGVAAVLAMVMITMGGIEYVTSELPAVKGSGKETIVNALLGLFIALGAWLILNTINPKLLNACLKLPLATVIISKEETLKNRGGGGLCAPVTDPSSPCSSTNLNSAFPGTNGNGTPFATFAAQASAICNLESHGVSNTLSEVDICANGKSFSFGLFQINAVAHMNSIKACNGAFSGGNFNCTTNEPAYTDCMNYLLDPNNNIKEARKIYEANPSWGDWSTHRSCVGKF